MPMTDQVQATTLLIAAGVVAVILFGLWVIVQDIIHLDTIEAIEDEIDDLAVDYFMGRDQHSRPHMGGRWSHRRGGCSGSTPV